MRSRRKWDWHRSGTGNIHLRHWPHTHRKEQIATVYRRGDGTYGFHIAGTLRNEMTFPDENTAVEHGVYPALGWRFPELERENNHGL